MYKGWIDIVSASTPIADTWQPDWTEEENQSYHATEAVLRHGAVTSQCNRRVIHISQVIKNMATLDSVTLERFGEAILQGICNYCCANEDWYLPKRLPKERTKS